MNVRLDRPFFERECPTVAEELAGKLLVCRQADGSLQKLRISETEAYCGETDTACHAHKGKTARTEVLYRQAGTVYVYLCYGVHWLLNIVTGKEGDPQAVLIRACETAEGPGRLTKRLGIDKRFNRQSVLTSTELWIEDDGARWAIQRLPRVGIGYASPEDQARLWRYKIKK